MLGGSSGYCGNIGLIGNFIVAVSFSLQIMVAMNGREIVGRVIELVMIVVGAE